MIPGVFMHFNYLLVVLLSLPFLFAPSTSVAADEGPDLEHYWTYQRFSELYPKHQLDAEFFSEQIRKKGTHLKAKDLSPVRIAIIYPGKQASDYWRRSVSSFEARLRESRVPYEIRTYFSKPGLEIRLQAEQIARALTHDPDYLVFTLDALKHRVIIERLMARNRPKVILQNITTPLKMWEENQPFLYVGFDHATGTEVLVEEYLKRVKPNARYAIFYGPRGYVSQMRGGTFKAAMSKQKTSLMAEYYVGFDRKKAKEAALQLLEKQPDLDFVFSCSTDIALGVIDAIQELGLEDKVITNGWGGGSSELEAIRNQSLDLTVMRMNDDNGAAMAEAILQDLMGQNTPTLYSGDIHLITKEMPDSAIQSLSERAFRYSNSWKSDLNAILKSER